MGYLNEDGLATLVGKVKGQVVQLTSAEYRNLPASKNSDNKTYFVTDEDYAYAIDDEPTVNSDNLVKSGGVYTYTSKIGSGTLTTTAQTIIPAINELDAAIDTLNNGLMTFTPVSAVSGRVKDIYGGYSYITNHLVYVNIRATMNLQSGGNQFAIISGLPSPMQDSALSAWCDGISFNCRVGTDGAILSTASVNADQSYGKYIQVTGCYYIN